VRERAAAPAPAPAEGASFLALDRISKAYQDHTALDALSLAVARGELLALLGPSGCGKSTALRIIAGLIPASAGRVAIAGRDVTHLPAYRRDIGLVFQSYALFPHMSVAQNVAFGLEMRKLARALIREKVEAALALVRLSGLGERRPRQLSGGQQQRVALARALVVEPSLLLLDEPLSNLDAKLRDEMRIEIRDIQQRLGITTIFVTHDQSEALAIADKVAVLNRGRLEQVGEPVALYERPASSFVAGFIGRTNRFAATGQGEGRVAFGDTTLRTAAPAHGAVEIMVRPHRIDIAPGDPPRGDERARNVLAGAIRRVTFVGEVIEVAVDVGGAVLTAELSTRQGGHDLAPGMQVAVSWEIADTLVFPRIDGGGA
jgi:putative spermidine/putrescine transport system ATP-binding protein